MIHPYIEKILSSIQAESSTTLIATAIVIFTTWICLVHLRKRPIFSCNDNEKKKKTTSGSTANIHDKQADSGSDSELKNMPPLEAELKNMPSLEAEDIEELESSGSADPKAVKDFMAKKRQEAFEIKLSESEKEKEEMAKKAQLSQIYALLNRDQEVFGGEMSMENFQDQLGMYVK